MFADLVVILSPRVSLPTTAMLLEHGATITKDAQMCTLAVVEATDRTEHVPNFEVIRGRRVPVAYAAWVDKCISTGRRLPLEHPLTQFNPTLFAGVQFTTSGLPRQLNDNVVGAMRFFGGTYCRHLTDLTQVVVVHKELQDAPKGPDCSKVATAAREAIAVVSIAYIQRCVSSSQLLPPLTKQYLRSKTKRERDDEVVTIDLSTSNDDHCSELLALPRGRRRDTLKSSARVGCGSPSSIVSFGEGRILTRSMRREIEAARVADNGPITRHRAREVAAILSPSSDKCGA